jgi:hypothetical protein
MSSAQGGLHVRASGGAALAIVVIALIGAGVQDLREGRPLPSPRALIPGNTEPVPPLAPGRPVNEQDCSKPIADWSANLKCK